MTANDTYYQRLMLHYYGVMLNNWTEQMKVTLRRAISMLSDIPRADKANAKVVMAVEKSIADMLGPEFAEIMRENTAITTEQLYRLGLMESGEGTRFAAAIKFSGLDYRYTDVLTKQSLFWIGNQHGDSFGKRINQLVGSALENGVSTGQLAQDFSAMFGTEINKGAAYWQGLAEHTALRTRQIARITGYEKAGAVGYEIVATIDERTSDICRSLHGKVFNTKNAVKVRDAMLNLDMSDAQQAKEYLKEVAPFVRDDQVVYTDGEPTGIQGNHVPFPPFHWRCRTVTRMVFE